MVSKIDRQKVRESFHRQSSDYDEHALVQRRVIERLLELLQVENPHPARLLDIGAGTGRLVARLRELYPESLTVAADLAFGMCRAARENLGERVQLVNADAEKLPFRSGAFDLVLSSSTFQWLPSLDHAFGEVRRVLAPGGLFCFALFGERTLFELRDSYRAALKGEADRTHSFFSRDEVLAALQGAGFEKASATAELEVEFHPDVPDLLKSLKKIGANTAGPAPRKGLSERRVMLEMMEAYRQAFRREGKIPATYEVIYGIGRKGTTVIE
jgi:malonyl-CoA O-methyltransferase